MDTETIDTQTTDTEATMRFSERRSYLIQMRKRYRTAAHVQKTALLDEMQTVTGLHRKHPLRLLRTPLRKERRPRARQRGVVYDGEVRAAVALIAQALDFPTAKRLQPQLGRTAILLARQEAVTLTPDLEEQLEYISVSPLRHLLAYIMRDLLCPAASPSPTTHTLMILSRAAARITRMATASSSSITTSWCAYCGIILVEYRSRTPEDRAV